MKTVTIKGVTLGEGSPKIIVPMVGRTTAELIHEAQQLTTIDCDLVEWRIDFYEEVKDARQVAKLSNQLATILQDKPLLITFRTKKEGGEVALSEETYFDLYRTIIKEGTLDLLDVELFMNDASVCEIIECAHRHQIKIVMCNHDFNQTPEKAEIIRRLCAMQEKQADICKIAVMPQNPTDVLTLLAATEEMSRCYADRPIVTMSMGQLGMISRMCGEVTGSAMTFGSAGKASAPGQVPVGELRQILTTLSL